MGISLRNSTSAAGSSPTWVRALALLVGVVVSAVVGYATGLVVVIIAIIVDAAPLLAGQSTPQQPWVTPVAVGAGVIVFGFGVRFCIRKIRQRPVAS